MYFKVMRSKWGKAYRVLSRVNKYLKNINSLLDTKYTIFQTVLGFMFIKQS